jgi:hypothetical protein
MSSHGVENISGQLMLLIHIPEVREATNMCTKNKFKSIQDSSLKTLKSEHILRQRKESVWIVGRQSGAALPLFPSTVITQSDKFYNAVLMKRVEENKNIRVSAIKF